MASFTDKEMEIEIGHMLRIGVSVSAAVGLSWGHSVSDSRARIARLCALPC